MATRHNQIRWLALFSSEVVRWTPGAAPSRQPRYHIALLTSAALLELGLIPAAKVLNLKGRPLRLRISPKGQALRAQNRWEEAIPEYETALGLDRNLVLPLSGLAWCKLNTGSTEEVIPLAEKAIHLSPRDPHIGSQYHLMGTVHLLQSRTDEAIVWLEKGAAPCLPYSSSAAGLPLPMRSKARPTGPPPNSPEARRLVSDDRYSSLARLKARYFGMPKIRALLEATYFAGLRKVGMPEE